MDYTEAFVARNWLGQDVVDFFPDDPIKPGAFLRITERYNQAAKAKQCFDALFAHKHAANCLGLVLGVYSDLDEGTEQYEPWEDAYSPTVALLYENADKLTGLRHIFLGDFDAAMHLDISMAMGGNIGELLNTFPGLETIHLLSSAPELIASVRHIGLKSLSIIGSGLDDEFIENLGECVFPDLEKLVLCPGGNEYGGMGENVGSIKRLIAANPFKSVRHLGLCSSTAVDQLIRVLAGSELLAQLESLDLSLGELTDKGADFLIKENASFEHLKSLDLYHNFLSDEKRTELTAAFPANMKLIVDPGNADPDDDWRYVGISE